MGSVLRLQHVSIPMHAGGNDKGRRFYGETLGLTEITPPGVLGTERFVWYRAGDDGHEVHLYTDDDYGQGSKGQHFCLQADDPDAVRKTLEANGYGTQDTDPIPNRPRFFTHDPFGNRVEISAILGDYE